MEGSYLWEIQPLKKGQKVYLLPLFLKGNTVPDVDKALVVVCGKTITADYKGHEFKFDKETHLDMDPYGPRFKLFLTLKEAEDARAERIAQLQAEQEGENPH